MENDFLMEIGVSGLTSRLKRLSDSLLYSTRDFYNSEGLEIEPNWHMIFLLFQKNDTLTITEISEALQLSHPGIVKLINKMKKKGYITSITDAEDSRKQQLQLSEKALKELPKLETYWKAGIQTIDELLEDNPEFMALLEKLEQKVAESNFKERTLNNYYHD